MGGFFPRKGALFLFDQFWIERLACRFGTKAFLLLYDIGNQCGFNSLSVHRDHITIGLVPTVIGVLWVERVILEPFWCAGQKESLKNSVGSSGARARPVLKHGPRRLTCMRVQWGTENPRGRNESDFFFSGKRKGVKNSLFSSPWAGFFKRRLRGEHAC